jgi:20S proteasome alpha/beta subunit
MEYIQKKIHRSTTIVALTCRDGLVIFAEKESGIVNKNLEDRSLTVFLNKINILVGTGLFQDFQRIVERAKIDSIAFRENFSSILVGKVLASRIASLIHLQTRYWHIRPLCCSLFLGSVNLNIPELFVITFTGHHFKCFSGALGDKSEIFRISMDKYLENSMTCLESFLKIYKLFKKTKKNFNFRSLEISCFSENKTPLKTPISCNLILEVDRQTRVD